MDPVSQNDLGQLAAQSPAGSLMGFSVWGLAAGIAVSTVGFFYFKHGKQNNNFFTMGIGVALMVFPYFVTQTLYIVLIAAGLILFHRFSGNS